MRVFIANSLYFISNFEIEKLYFFKEKEVDVVKYLEPKVVKKGRFGSR